MQRLSLSALSRGSRLTSSTRSQALGLSRGKYFTSARLGGTRVSALRLSGVKYTQTVAFLGIAATVSIYLATRDEYSVLLEAPVSSPENTISDPATSIPFPTTIQPDPSNPPLTLVGLGVRTVSFLKMKVYSVAFYADSTKANVPPGASFDDTIDAIIANSAVAIRIVPTRGTNFTHLRDAFLRTLRGRIQARQTEGVLSSEEEDALEEPLVQLRTLFPNAPLHKGKSLLIYSVPSTTSSQRALVLDGIGKVENAWISREFFKAYFVGEGNSPALLQSVKEALA